MNQINYNEIGERFAQEFYSVLQTSRASTAEFYHENARMTYEGAEVIGKPNIAQKFQSIQCNTLKVAITNVDTQPVDSALLIHVNGQLQSDNDRPLPFSEVFLLTPVNSCLLVSNSMFRLSLHHF
ncbi:unnamed protein product [Dicrocoelium dendriticum]|nr:unnamed protein product [Dicrocoelium dendriticum]